MGKRSRVDIVISDPTSPAGTEQRWRDKLRAQARSRQAPATRE